MLVLVRNRYHLSFLIEALGMKCEAMSFAVVICAICSKVNSHCI